jgi:arginase
MSGVRLIQVPYHLGRRDEVLGAGPAPLAAAIGDDSTVVERPGMFRNEIGASFDIARALSDVVRGTLERGEFPLVLAGNCSTALGTVTGLDRDVGVVWFDAHADLHTPDTSPSGFFDGMALAALIGEGWSELRRGLAAVHPDNVLLVGARDFDPTERVDAVRRADARSLERALDELTADAVYVHIDLDVLDAAEARANDWASEGGFTAAELDIALDAIAARFEVVAAAFTAYDPRFDEDGRVPRIAASLVPRLLRAEVAS